MSEGPLRIAILAFGVLNLALGGLMVVAPGTFFEELGSYGARNDHYVADYGTAYLAVGAGLVIAAARPAWRVPILTVAALWYGLHALNHLADIGEARSDARGIVDTVLLALGAGALAFLARASAGSASAGSRDGPKAEPPPTEERPPP